MLLRGVGALIYVRRRGLLDVIPGDMKKVWKRWEVELLVVLSIFVQVMLITLGHRRKYIGSRTRIRFVIWLTYLLADWLATVALGVISQNAIDDCKKQEDALDELMSFWAPFLLLHLGGPDTITAYSLEDNELWLRHLVGLVIQTGLAFYILLVALPGSSWLPFSSIPILLAGLIKFGERTWALRSANIERLRDSMLTDPDPGPNYANFMEEFTLRKAEGYHVEAAEVKELPVPADYSYPYDEGKLIPEAYDRFQTFKRLFVDLILSFQDRESSQSYFQIIQSHQAFNVVEVELGFAFDMLYTKAPIIYTVRGCTMRLITLSCTCLGLIAFLLLCEKDKYHQIDLIITYSLLVIAILLEIYAVIIQLNSDWTDCWLHKHNKTRDCLISSCFHQSTKQRWSNCMAQYNLLSICLNEKPAFCYKFQKVLMIDQFREEHRYKTYEKVSLDLKSLIFNQFKEGTGINEFGPTMLYSRKSSFALSNLLPDCQVEFDQSILILHIATDLCYYLDQGENMTNLKCRESKHLSDYMLYLLVLHPFMLPIGIGMIRFRDTCAEAKEFFQERRLDRVEACQKLLQVNTEVSPVKVKGDRSKSVLFDACRLAKSLQSRDKKHKWDEISRVWIELLAYAATHCRGYHHAQQLIKGGELLTHVWLLMAHLGITEQFQIYQGHARAKLVAK